MALPRSSQRGRRDAKSSKQSESRFCVPQFEGRFFSINSAGAAGGASFYIWLQRRRRATQDDSPTCGKLREFFEPHFRLFFRTECVADLYRFVFTCS